jgi:hypothetical protein
MIFSSTPSTWLSSALDLSMRFCSCSIFCKVLSRNGAEKATWSAEPPFSLMSSFRGRFLTSSMGGSGSLGLGLWGEEVRLEIAFAGKVVGVDGEC